MATKRRKLKSKAKKFGLKLFPVAKTLAAPVSFIEQISAKHRETMGSSFSQAPATQKLKILSNIVTGSTTGFNFFKDEFQAPLSQMKIENIFNKWTTAGGAMLAYGVLSKHVNKAVGNPGAPIGGKVKSIGKQLIIGGALGGFFDDKPTSQQSSTVGTAHLSPQPTLQLSAMRVNNGGSSDSTESGL